MHWLVPWHLRRSSSHRVVDSATLQAALAAMYSARYLTGILGLTILSSLFNRGSGDLPLLKLQSSAAVGLHRGVVFDDARCTSEPSLMHGAGLPGIVQLRAVPWATKLQPVHLH